MSTLKIGSKCAVLLPRKIINEQITPAKGLIINNLLGKRALVLIEEVWKFKFPLSAPLKDKIHKDGRIVNKNWGWTETPSFLEENKFIALEFNNESLMPLDISILEKMIKKSIVDFKRINNLL